MVSPTKKADDALIDHVLTDLSRYASQRSQQAIETILELVDDDVQRHTIVTVCAINMVAGAAEYMHGASGQPLEACKMLVLKAVYDTILKPKKK